MHALICTFSTTVSAYAFFQVKNFSSKPLGAFNHFNGSILIAYHANHTAAYRYI